MRHARARMHVHACMRIFQLMTPLICTLKNSEKYFQIFHKKIKLKIIIFKNSKFSFKGDLSRTFSQEPQLLNGFRPLVFYSFPPQMDQRTNVQSCVKIWHFFLPDHRIWRGFDDGKSGFVQHRDKPHGQPHERPTGDRRRHEICARWAGR